MRPEIDELLGLNRNDEADVDRAGHQRVRGRAKAREWDVDHLDAGLRGNHGHGQVRRAAEPGAAVIQTSRMAFPVSDQIREGLELRLAGIAERIGLLRDAADEGEIVRHFVGQRLDGRQHRETVRHGPQQRVAARVGLGDKIGAKLRRRARLVFDDELLMQPLAEFLGDDAAGQVGAGAGRERDDELHRPRRIILRGGAVRGERDESEQRDNAGAHSFLPDIFVRHCERSEAIQFCAAVLDRFVACSSQ